MISIKESREVIVSIGQIIRNRREELGLTQEELSDKMKYKDKSIISKVENSNSCNFTRKTLEKYAKALDVPVEYFTYMQNGIDLNKHNSERMNIINELQIFENYEFGSVRTVTVEGEPYFVGKDVAEILGYTNTQKAIRDHVDDEDKLTERIVLSGQNREMIFINESGLYSLILSSKMPNAKKFKRWVTSEVLPTIRKHGAYMTNEVIERTLTDPDYLIHLATALKEERHARQVAEQTVENNKTVIKQLEHDAERMKPKEVFADAVSTSETTILIGELAKLLKQNGIDIGQKRLFKWLRTNKYLMKNNEPTQKSMEMKLFEIMERTVNNPDGTVRITRTTKVTGKGQIYFVNKFLAAD